MRVIVTGVAGFVGSSLADELLQLGHEVVGVDCFVDYYSRAVKERNIAAALQHPKFEFVEGSLHQLDLTKLLSGADWVFHQAGQAGVRASWGQYFSSYVEHNILASQRLLEAAKSVEVRKSLKKIVFASSSSVYGNAEILPTSETVLPLPVSPYGVTKLASEHLMGLYSREFDVPSISLRYFTVYGPRQRPDMSFNIFSRAALLGEEIRVFGDGEQSRDFTFIADIVRANIQAAESPTAELVFNIGGGSRVTMNQVLATLETIVGRPLRIVRTDRMAGDARHTGADTTRAQRELGYAPQVSLEQGLRAEVAWMERELETR